MSEWQPISTAPKDTLILTYYEYGEPAYGVSWYRVVKVTREDVESESTNSKGRRRIIQERTEEVRQWEGTHWEPPFWMPLPQPPKDTP